MPVARNFFQKIPFIRITSLFLIGILLSHYLHFEPHWIGFILTLLISVLILFWHNSNYTAEKIQNVLIAGCIVLIGIFYPTAPNEKQYTFDHKDYYLAELCQKPAEKAKTFQTILLIQNRTLVKPEKVLAYFSKPLFGQTLTTGDQLIILAQPSEIRNAGNPYEIDYQSMMRQQGIRFSLYLTEGTYLKTGHKVNRLVYKAEQVRDKLISILATALTEKEERSVVSALTLGYRAEIDQETNDYFASTGAMHVLSVSGLHVALIYFILGFFLSFIKRIKAGVFIFSAVMITLLWGYAFITGFSPSVQRATVMFTFVIIGEGLRRQVNIYNSLTASAFLLILLNPNVIFDIGFQLSYLAVFGIVLIQPALNNLFEITNPILKWSWTMLTVSLAAQLTTFPLTLFYFNQFPNLFWLSGYVVIPVTTLIIWLTLVFFIISPIHGLAMVVGAVIQTITHFMLFVLKTMDALPLAVSKGIVLNMVQVFLLFGCISVVIIWISSKKKVWLFSLISLVLLFQIDKLVEKRRLFNQHVIQVYNTKSPMIHFINGRTNYLITNDFKNLSRTENQMLKKVCYHLKLDSTQVISGDLSKPISYNDLVVKEHRVQFLNSVLNLNSVFKRSGQMELAVYPQRGKANPIVRTINTGNVSFGKKHGSDSFEIKRDGALCANLKVE